MHGLKATTRIGNVCSFNIQNIIRMEDGRLEILAVKNLRTV